MKNFSAWKECWLLPELFVHFFDPPVKKPDSAAATGFFRGCQRGVVRW